MKILPHLAAAFAIALCGCASYGGSSLRAGASEGEVRGVMGAPALEFTGADGARRLVYPRGPLGTQTFVARLGQDGGGLQEIRQVLNDDTFNRIRPGLAEQDILHMIGPPGETMHFARTDTTAWDYRYVDTWGYTAIFSVTFDNKGVVVSKITRRVERNSRF